MQVQHRRRAINEGSTLKIIVKKSHFLVDQFWPESYYDIDLENISKESKSWTVRQFQTKIFLENSSCPSVPWFHKKPSLVNFSESCTQDRILENGSESFKPNRTVVFNPFIFTTLEVKSVGGVFKMFTRWMIQNRCLLPKLFWNSGFQVNVGRTRISETHS